MKKLYLIMFMTISIYADQYLPFILQAIKTNLKMPVKLSYGEIYKVNVINNDTLILYIHTTKKVIFQKKKICNLPLFKDIIKEKGTIKYILDGKTKGDFTFNQKTCKKQN